MNDPFLDHMHDYKQNSYIDASANRIKVKKIDLLKHDKKNFQVANQVKNKFKKPN